MRNRDEPVQFILTVGVDNTISIQNEDGSDGVGWGPGTVAAEEIIEALEEEGML